MGYPVFNVGEVLTANDMNAVGLWLIKTQTIGSGVSSVTVSDVFSADFDVYRITISSGVGSATSVLQLSLGSTGTGYYYGGKARTYAGADLNVQGANQANWYAGESNVNAHTFDVILTNPYLAKNTLISAMIAPARTDGYSLFVSGYLANTTSYTAFTITPNTGTITGGTIRVYGYRN